MNNSQKQVWYTKNWVIVTLLILFFPAGLFLMWRYTDWNKNTKLIITGLLVIASIFSLSTKPTESPKNETNNLETSSQQTTQDEVAEETSDSEPPLSGLTVADIKLDLEKQGLECSGPENLDDNIYQWLCEREFGTHRFLVEIFGTNATNVSGVTATATNIDKIGLTKNEDLSFLGHIATLPYDDAQSGEARKWVENSNIEGWNESRKTTENIFGQARFSIGAKGSSAVLSIFHIDSSLD